MACLICDRVWVANAEVGGKLKIIEATWGRSVLTAKVFYVLLSISFLCQCHFFVATISIVLHLQYACESENKKLEQKPGNIDVPLDQDLALEKFFMYTIVDRIRNDKKNSNWKSNKKMK